jgi:peptidoglycan/xylan/chitin deacetylase (PgdA/CDA1 family)
MYELGLLLTPLFARRKPSLVVYCYHSISDDDWKYSVSKEAFKAQIEFLLSQATPFDPKNIGAYLEGTYTLQSDAFLITFDDGYQDILAVKDFLAEQKITPIVFVLSHAERADREELETNRPFLSSAEIRRLHTEGWVIGSHSATHPDFTDLDSSRMEDEIVGSRHSLGQMIGSTVNLFAYPKGAYSTALCGAVRDAGYAVAFSVDDGYVEPQGNSYTIPRVGVDGTHHMRQFKSLALPGSMWLRGSVRKIVSLFAQSRI